MVKLFAITYIIEMSLELIFLKTQNLKLRVAADMDLAQYMKTDENYLLISIYK